MFERFTKGKRIRFELIFSWKSSCSEVWRIYQWASKTQSDVLHSWQGHFQRRMLISYYYTYLEISVSLKQKHSHWRLQFWVDKLLSRTTIHVIFIYFLQQSRLVFSSKSPIMLLPLRFACMYAIHIMRIYSGFEMFSGIVLLRLALIKILVLTLLSTYVFTLLNNLHMSFVRRGIYQFVRRYVITIKQRPWI